MNNTKITVPNCPHLNQVENYENSFSVCTDCGLEVEQIFSNPPPTSNEKQWLYEQSFFKTFEDKQFDFIDNCVRRDKLPDSCVYDIYDYYLKLKSKHQQKTNLNQVAGVAIYKWKIKNEAEGLLVEDVSAITHIDKEKIFKCEMKKRVELDITHPNR